MHQNPSGLDRAASPLRECGLADEITRAIKAKWHTNYSIITYIS
jgi:hypothetical protein